MSEQIPVEKIKSSPFQARRVFDDASIQELAQAIKEEGLIQLITVRRVNDGFFELIAGERRLRAVKQLGWQTVEALILDNVSDQQAATKGLIENLQREDLNPLERAQGYRSLVVQFGMTHDDVAKKMGMSNNVSVSRHLALLDMPQEIQDLLPRGSISETHCRSIRQIPDKAKQIEVARQADKEGWSVKQTEKEVQKVLEKAESGEKEGNGAKPKIVDPLAPLWQKLESDRFKKGAWSVGYLKEDEWVFHFKPNPEKPMDALADLLDNLGTHVRNYYQKLEDAKEAVHA